MTSAQYYIIVCVCVCVCVRVFSHYLFINICMYFPDVDVALPSVGPAVLCGVGMTLGILGVAAGTFFFIKGKNFANDYLAV